MFLQVTMTETKDSTSSRDSPKQCRSKSIGKTKERQSSNRPSCTGTTSENMHRTPTNKKSRQLRLSNAPSKDNHCNSSQTTESSGSYGNIFCENLTPDKTSCISDETLSWRDWLKRTLGFGNSPEVRSRASQSCPAQSGSDNLHSITIPQNEQSSKDVSCSSNYKNIAENVKITRSEPGENENKNEPTEKEEGPRGKESNMSLGSAVSRSPSPGTSAASRESGALVVPRRSSRLASTSTRGSRSDTSHKR